MTIARRLQRIAPSTPAGSNEFGVPGARPAVSVRPSAADTGLVSATTQSMTGSEALAAVLAQPIVDGYRTLSGVDITSRLTLDDPVLHSALRFENCRIQGGIYAVQSFTGSGEPAVWNEFRHCELYDASSACFYGGYTRLLRCDLHNAPDTTKPSRGLEIWASWLHDLYHEETGHCDAVQIVSGAAGSLFHYNNMEAFNSADSPSAPGEPSNSVLQTGTVTGDIGPVEWRGNWFDGGHYTIRSADPAEYTVNYLFRNNRFGRNFDYGPVTSLGSSDFDSSNVWDDTGLPVLE